VPNLRGQSIDANGISLVGSDGRSITLTKAQMQAFYQTTSGNAASRKAQVIAWVKDQITAALGAEQVPQSLITFDVDAASGTPTRLEVS
jgi:hypothetical protein